MANGGFKLEVQQNIVWFERAKNAVCCFAPEGRDVYSPWSFSLLRSSVGA
jgi:hypothetical protein